jgi:excinuclease UvrABC ATPase subunit
MLAADRMIDMGPGPGEKGGHIVFDGSTQDLKNASTLTGDYLGGRKQVGMGFKRPVTDNTPKPHLRRRQRAQPQKCGDRISLYNVWCASPA